LPNISLTRTSYFSKIFYYISFEGPTLIVAWVVSALQFSSSTKALLLTYGY
jgi:hypothetical protein